ncbi:hypothetical protein AADZ90_004825 [Aestuariibius sp. 2305UL40-4]|uniref:hypothetical protein n=1 Tax=Aestuariibius violaceus TaxID=3234132 RepID=UPI00345E4C6F
MRITCQDADRFTLHGLPHLTIAASLGLAGLAALALVAPALIPPALTTGPINPDLLPAGLALASLLTASIGAALGMGEADFDAMSDTVRLGAGLTGRRTLPLDTFRGARLGQLSERTSRVTLLFDENGQQAEHPLSLPLLARGKAPEIVFALNLWQIRRGGAVADELADIPASPVNADGRGLPWGRREAQF